MAEGSGGQAGISLQAENETGKTLMPSWPPVPCAPVVVGISEHVLTAIRRQSVRSFSLLAF